MSSLPRETLELIFSNLPIQDLLNGAALVCRDWNEIISSSVFLRHKKQYFRYRLDPERDSLSKKLVWKSRLQDHVRSQVEPPAPLRPEMPAPNCVSWMLQEIHGSKRTR